MKVFKLLLLLRKAVSCFQLTGKQKEKFPLGNKTDQILLVDLPPCPGQAMLKPGAWPARNAPDLRGPATALSNCHFYCGHVSEEEYHRVYLGQDGIWQNESLYYLSSVPVSVHFRLYA